MATKTTAMENRQHISLREGKVYVDGVQILDACKLSFVVTPEVATSKRLGDKGTDRRWIGRDITGSITEYKSTNWVEDALSKYEKNGKTPELKIQGIRNDTNSDYYSTYKKSETVTLTGVVLTGDIPLLDLDTGGDLAQRTINFGAKNYK
jgi:hypothetical protein